MHLRSMFVVEATIHGHFSRNEMRLQIVDWIETYLIAG